MDDRDICGFVNSRDVRDYLLEIRYQFTAMEAAWLVYRCRRLTMEDRHCAWHEIIHDMPDHSVSERITLERSESFHAWLEQYMHYEKHGLLAVFFEPSFTFDAMCFAFPAPFRRGDILTDCTDVPAPFELSYLATWDSKTMLERGFQENECPDPMGWAHWDKSVQRLLSRIGNDTDMYPIGRMIDEEAPFCGHVPSLPTNLEYYVPRAER